MSVKLDSLITVLACLTSTQNNDLTPITKNSLETLSIDNTTGGCPLSTLSGMTARIQNLAMEMEEMKDLIGGLEAQITDLKRNGNNRLESRSLFPSPSMYAPSASSSIPSNCVDQKKGIIRIKPAPDVEPFAVYCDQEVRDGGWIRVANRFDGSEDFYRRWQDYKIGFGSLNTEFFLGLDKLHMITNSDTYELLILLENRQKERRFAIYDHFSIGNENEKYLLNVLGSYAGDAGDSLRYHAGKKFTTYDQDNDDNGQNCAKIHAGAWWYGADCFHSNLFGQFQGVFQERQIDNFKGILWKTFLPGPVGSLSKIKIMIRPRRS